MPGSNPGMTGDGQVKTCTGRYYAAAADAFFPGGGTGRICALQDELARLPVLDARTPERIVGYNENGLFD